MIHNMGMLLINMHMTWSFQTPPQAAIRAVRNARAEYNVEPGRRIAATVVVADPALRAAFEAEQGVVAALAKLDGEQLQVWRVGGLFGRVVGRCLQSV